MTQARKDELIEQYLTDRLTAEGRAELTEAVRSDATLRERLRFEVGVRDAFRRREIARLEKGFTEAKVRVAPRRTPALAMLVGGLLLLACIIWWWTGRPAAPTITPGEGMHLMDGVVAQGDQSGNIGRSAAGGGDWQDKLLRRDYAAAGQELRAILRQNPPCDNLDVAYYSATLALYIDRSATAAQAHLACYADRPISERLRLPLIVRDFLLGDVESANEAFSRSGYPLDTLPSSLRRELARPRLN